VAMRHPRGDHGFEANGAAEARPVTSSDICISTPRSPTACISRHWSVAATVALQRGIDDLSPTTAVGASEPVGSDEGAISCVPPLAHNAASGRPCDCDSQGEQRVRHRRKQARRSRAHSGRSA
jgi:hypothetical protein